MVVSYKPTSMTFPSSAIPPSPPTQHAKTGEEEAEATKIQWFVVEREMERTKLELNLELEPYRGKNVLGKEEYQRARAMMKAREKREMMRLETVVEEGDGEGDEVDLVGKVAKFEEVDLGIRELDGVEESVPEPEVKTDENEVFPIPPRLPAKSLEDTIKDMPLRGFLVVPMMSGVQYWRETPTPTTELPPGGGQYAISIDTVNVPSSEHRSKIEPLKAMYHRAKKIHILMPSIKCGSFKRSNGLDDMSDPDVFKAISYDDVEEGLPPTIMTRHRYSDDIQPLVTIVREESSTSLGRTTYGCPIDPQIEVPQEVWTPLAHTYRYPSDPNATSLDTIGAVPSFSSSASSLPYYMTPPTRPPYPDDAINDTYDDDDNDDDFRPTLSSASTMVDSPRKRSFGSLLLSEASTFVSSRAPSSFRARPISIATTSSFGCVDGMPAEQREAQRLRRDQGVKGKMRKIVRKAKALK